MPSSYIFTAVVISYVPVLFASFFLFDQLIMTEYFDHHRQWEADGKPHGVFWVPKESTFANGLLVRLGSSVASHRRSYLWLFATPKWTKHDRTARRLLSWLRALIFGWHLALAGAVLLVIFR